MRDVGREGLQTADKVLVTVTERLATKTLLRRAWRTASGLHAELIAVHVETGKRLNDNASANLASHLRLAEDLGARVVKLKGSDVAAALARFVREEHVTQVLVLRPSRSRWQELTPGSLINRLLRLLPDVDIHIISERPGTTAT